MKRLTLPANGLDCAVFCENNLPELNISGTECAGTREQIVLPHSFKPVAESVLKFMARHFENYYSRPLKSYHNVALDCADPRLQTDLRRLY